MRADELLKMLEQDEEYQKIMAEKAARNAADYALTVQAEASLVSRLRERGIDLDGLGECMNLPNSVYADGLDLIGRHFFETDDLRSKESALRALICPGVPADILSCLIAHRPNESNEQNAWLIGLILEKNISNESS